MSADPARRPAWYRRRWIPLWVSIPWYLGAMLAILIAVVGGERLTFDLRWWCTSPMTLSDFGVTEITAWAISSRWMVDQPVAVAIRTIVNRWWRLVFWTKHRTGFLDMGRDIAITGVVVKVEPPGADGDGNFDVELDPGLEPLITIGGRLTTADVALGPAMHCEVEPWAPAVLRERFARLRVGDRVIVAGRHGFDGVHTGRAEWIEVLLALVRHQPNVRDGWFEIHPVTEIAAMTETARPPGGL